MTGTRTAAFTINNGMRRGFGGPPALSSLQIGDSAVLGTGHSIDYGDGTSQPIQYVVRQINENEDWVILEGIMTRTYAADTNNGAPYVAKVTIANRIKYINIPTEQPFLLQTQVRFDVANTPPRSLSFPTVYAQGVVGQPLWITAIPAVDVDGQPLSYRFATATELGAPSFTLPPNLFLNPSTGDLMWLITNSTTLAVTGGLYALQVIISDGLSTCPVDFVISVKLAPAVCAPSCTNYDTLCGSTQQCTGCTSPPETWCTTNLPPAFISPTPDDGAIFCTTTGRAVTFNFVASDTDAANASAPVRLVFNTVPAGATVIVSGNNPVTAVFTWIPTAAQSGSFILCAVAADTHDAYSAQRCITILVNRVLPAATVRSLSPVRAYYAQSTFVNVTGVNFTIAGPQCFSNNTAVTATYVSSSDVQCVLPSVPVPQIVPVQVASQCCNTSQALNFEFYGTPVVSVATPGTVIAHVAQTITVMGSTFWLSTGYMCGVNGNAVSATRLNISAVLCAAPALPFGTVSVDVRNTAEGWTSNSVAFNVAAWPQLLRLVPNIIRVNTTANITLVSDQFILFTSLQCLFESIVVTARVINTSAIECMAPLQYSARATNVSVTNGVWTTSALLLNYYNVLSVAECPLSGNWTFLNGVCVLQNLTANVTVITPSPGSNNSTNGNGTVNNNGTSDNGTVNNNGTSNNGTINNNGTVNNNGTSDNGTVNNNGTSNNGTINNNGTVNNNGTSNNGSANGDNGNGGTNSTSCLSGWVLTNGNCAQTNSCVLFSTCVGNNSTNNGTNAIEDPPENPTADGTATMSIVIPAIIAPLIICCIVSLILFILWWRRRRGGKTKRIDSVVPDESVDEISDDQHVTDDTTALITLKDMKSVPAIEPFEPVGVFKPPRDDQRGRSASLRRATDEDELFEIAREALLERSPLLSPVLADAVIPALPSLSDVHPPPVLASPVEDNRRAPPADISVKRGNLLPAIGTAPAAPAPDNKFVKRLSAKMQLKDLPPLSADLLQTAAMIAERHRADKERLDSLRRPSVSLAASSEAFGTPPTTALFAATDERGQVIRHMSTAAPLSPFALKSPIVTDALFVPGEKPKEELTQMASLAAALSASVPGLPTRQSMASRRRPSAIPAPLLSDVLSAPAQAPPSVAVASATPSMAASAGSAMSRRRPTLRPAEALEPAAPASPHATDPSSPQLTPQTVIPPVVLAPPITSAPSRRRAPRPTLPPATDLELSAPISQPPLPPLPPLE
eukprot:TRINITY_DN1129_c0_g2_i3.p1 TRINITY_DN1129_c0_g2~~TRINITY_DN1129_c0_g2_i3.p1  ORF type:complete len:1249 (-),score=300.10 TRINITY_DN1129_c0_g2_i3:48-3794(-)